MKRITQFFVGSVRLMFGGGIAYHTWMALLTLLVLSGALAYWRQLSDGLVVTNMRDQVSWAFYIGNFTFLVGVAAAAVMLVVPAYIYHWKPIKEIVIMGELLAVAAIASRMPGTNQGLDLGRGVAGAGRPAQRGPKRRA